MWSVRICPLGTRASALTVLDECCTRTGRTWTSGVVRIRFSEISNGEYRDWNPEDVYALERAVGRLPQWVIRIDAPDGDTEEVRRIVLAVLTREGGIALDDQSTHSWTAEQITRNATVHGRRFLTKRDG